MGLMCPPLKNRYEFLTEGNFNLNHIARIFISLSCKLVDTFESIQPPNDDIPRLIHYVNDEIAEKLFHTAFMLQAKSPVDKIYGLYGLLTVYCNIPLPAPDYTKTAADVYEETVWAWISDRNDLSILKLATRSDYIHELPSWVPAWHREHPNFINKKTSHPFMELNPERYMAFSYGHFAWAYKARDDMRLASWEEAQKFGPIATLMSPGKLRILRARYVGMVSHAIGIDEPGNYFETINYYHLHLRWCRLIHDVFSHSTPKFKGALHEMFRSLQLPGIYEHTNMDAQSAEEEAEMFRSWFDFMLYVDRALPPPTSTSSSIYDGRMPPRSAITGGKGGGLYYYMIKGRGEENAEAVLKEYYDGDVKGREGIANLARNVRKVHLDLIRVRNHALCILDNDNMIAVANYWCREGDEVFVFPGTDCPFILRREPDGDSYRLVGPALVDRLYRTGYQNWRTEGDDLQVVTLV